MRKPWAIRATAHADVDPATLHAHPLNFRQHPPAQKQAVLASLDLLGFIDSVLVSARTNTILNGHLRVELALANGEPTIPVVFVDVGPEDEALILATYDRLGTIAPIDAGKLQDLITTSDVGGDVQAHLDQWLTEFTLTERPLMDAGALEPSAPNPEVVIAIGPFRQTVPLLTYRAWRDDIAGLTEDDGGQLRTEILRRLGLDGERHDP